MGFPVQLLNQKRLGGVPGVVKANARALYLTRPGAYSSTRLLDQSPINSGTRRTGEQGRCYTADGIDDNVNLGTDFIGTGDITLTAWIKPDTYGLSGEGRIFDNGKAIFFVNSVSNRLRFTSDGGANQARADNVITLGQWQHVAVVRAGDVATLYVNGVDATAASNAGTPVVASANLIMLNNASNTRAFEGGIFDTRIYNKALTAAEISYIYTFGESGNNPTNANLLAQYKCDEQSGTTAYDSSGNGNNGTLTNITAGTFHATQDIWSFQNQVGYNEGSNLIKDSLTLVSGWSGSNITLMSGINDPDGGVNAIKVEATSTAATSLAQVIQPLAASSGYYVYSCYIKKGSSGTDFGYLNLRINSGPRIGNIAIGLINFDTGVLTVIGNANAAGSITDVGDGWYLVEIYDDTIVAGDQMRVYVASGGSNLSAGIFAYFYAPQLEAGTQRRATQLTGDYYLTEDTILPRDESDPTNDVLGNPLTYTGKRPNDAELINSNCVTLNGTNQAVRVADNTALDITDNLTVSVWAKNDNALLSTFATMVGKYDAGSNKREFFLGLDSSEKIYVAIGSAGGTSASAEISSDAIDPTELHHYVATFKSGTVKLYMNGVLIPSTKAGAHVTTLNNEDADLTIGSILNSGTPAYLWDGQILDARIYAGDSTVLTAEQIASIYADPTGNVEFAGQDLRAHYKLAEGAGPACLDASGNANHGTIVNAVTNWGVKQDVYHSNLLEGCGKRMWFDGVNDYVSVAGMTASTNYFGACTISAKIYIEDASTSQVVWALGSSCYRLFISSGTYGLSSIQNTGVAVTEGYHEVSVDFDSSGRATSFTLDGVEAWTGLTSAGSGAATVFYIGARDLTGIGLFWKGLIYDFSITGSSVKNFSFNGYDSTDAGWIDTTGNGNNGTVVGSPEPCYIPASTSALDAFGQPLTDPFIDGFRNRAETEFDYNPDSTPEMGVTQLGITVPTAHAFGDAFAASTQIFARQRTATEDRNIVMTEAQTGAALTAIQNYTAP